MAQREHVVHNTKQQIQESCEQVNLSLFDVSFVLTLISNESVIYECNLQLGNDLCTAVAKNHSPKGWLSHVNAKFIPLKNGIIRIGECSVNRGQPYYHLQYVTRRGGEMVTTCLTQGTFEVLKARVGQKLPIQIRNFRNN